jgi:hypothetical protein
VNFEQLRRAMISRGYIAEQEMVRDVAQLEDTDFMTPSPVLWPARAENFWRGCWREACNSTFLSLIVAIRPVDTLPATSSDTNLRRMSTTARKENRCGIAASIAPIAVPRIVRPQPSAKDVRRKCGALRLPIAHFSFTWMNQPDKWHGPWRPHLLTNVREELATRSKLYLLNLSSE